MATRVLVPIDGSEMGERALEYALNVHKGAEITVLHVVGTPSSMMGQATGLALADDIGKAAQEQAQGVLAEAIECAESHGVEIETEVKVGHPARTIINQAEGFDVVVIGAHSGSLTDRLFVGNIAKTVFRRSPVPVTVVR